MTKPYKNECQTCEDSFARPGDVFNRLTVISVFFENKKKKLVVRCECGTVKTVMFWNVKYSHTKSCGCLAKETLSDLRKTHGSSQTHVYAVWCNMIQRVKNPKNSKWANYGGRGIKVCKRWDSFENFLEDMGRPEDGMQIDRIENDGDYTKDNCRWATLVENQRNKRTNVFVEFEGITMTVAEASTLCGVNRHTLYARVKKGFIGNKLFLQVDDNQKLKAEIAKEAA